jgi:glycine/D-amino acid oxidase-like deaminating enzyme
LKAARTGANHGRMIDYLIIGGGVAGLSCAAHLAPHATVTLLEGETALGHHASGRSAAMFLENYGNDTVRALNRASAAHLHAAGALRPRDFLLLADAQGADLLSPEADSFGASEIAVAQAATLLPILNPATVTRAARLTGAMDLDTHAVMEHFRRSARANGAEIATGERVNALSATDSGWQASTQSGGTLTARHIVNAAGAWADAVARMAGVPAKGIQPFRRSMARLPAPGGHDTTHWPFVDAVGESWYAKPDAGGWLVSPSEEDPQPPHDAYADDLTIAEGLDRYSRYVTEPVTRVTATWAGLRSFAPDRALVIGPDPAAPSFLWCAGQGGYGFQTAFAAGRLLADHALQRSPELDSATIAALDPARFAP